MEFINVTLRLLFYLTLDESCCIETVQVFGKQIEQITRIVCEGAQKHETLVAKNGAMFTTFIQDALKLFTNIAAHLGTREKSLMIILFNQQYVRYLANFFVNAKFQFETILPNAANIL